MPGVEVTSYSQLPEAERELPRTNWVASGSGDVWTRVADERYGSVEHTLVVNAEGTAFDKINLVWTPGSFVVVYRRNPEREERVEYLLPTELRPLLRDESGNQGNVSIRNIPQGIIKVWKNETPEEAALRETVEEVGVEPISMVPIGEIYPDAANSETPMHFFLAEVPFRKNQTYEQRLHPGEEIYVGEGDWFGIEDIPALKLQCAKTLAGIMLSTGFLGEWNNYQETETAEQSASF